MTEIKCWKERNTGQASGRNSQEVQARNKYSKERGQAVYTVYGWGERVRNCY
jgi:hypothetical protein